ncbi:MAG: aminotransferase class I/II-fold pyridoxal phosphate-dependent enzyme [Methylobacteriaceae bacterium]|nr:aminotransferase class I/II-fold pyridoxal phosphate-dependent enzyme [Methylobacteriaceae bacterium]
MSGEGGKVDLASILTLMRDAPNATRVAAQPATRASDPDFESLPQYKQIAFQRQFAELAGLVAPYYQLHETRAGAHTVIDGRPLLNFASYDYIGLNGHPEVVAAAEQAMRDFGTSVSAARISSGERSVHRALERGLASVYEAQDCVVFNSGHAGGVSTVASLVGPKDLVVVDALIHNCVTMGAKLSGAARRTFPHNDLEALDALLGAERKRFERVLIATEGLFSMDGDGPDLARLVEIKERHGCWLMIDDAHGLGVLGARGLGVHEHQGVDPRRVDIWFGTLSKSLVGCGGYVAGAQALVDLLKYSAPGFVYSVGMPAPIAAASTKALELMLREPERVARQQANSRRFFERAKARGLDVGSAHGHGVIPLIVGETVRTVVLAQRLQEAGICAFPILPPGVPEKSARLRFFITSAHAEAEIDRAIDAVADILAEIGHLNARDFFAMRQNALKP